MTSDPGAALIHLAVKRYGLYYPACQPRNQTHWQLRFNLTETTCPDCQTKATT